MDDRNRLAISTLNSLIQTCDDGSQGFLMAADAVQDAALKELFRTYGRERDELAEELRGEVRRLGGTPELDGSVAGTVHRGWINIRMAIAGKNDSAIIAEAERGEDVAVQVYLSAMQTDLPPDVRSIVDRQLTQVKTAHDRVRDLEKSVTR
jgi:uncharacterized protein (TIGR02284 family)